MKNKFKRNIKYGNKNNVGCSYFFFVLPVVGSVTVSWGILIPAAIKKNMVYNPCFQTYENVIFYEVIKHVIVGD